MEKQKRISWTKIISRYGYDNVIKNPIRYLPKGKKNYSKHYLSNLICRLKRNHFNKNPKINIFIND